MIPLGIQTKHKEGGHFLGSVQSGSLSNRSSRLPSESSSTSIRIPNTPTCAQPILVGLGYLYYIVVLDVLGDH